MLAVVALIVWGMKRHYADARPDDLWWILSPTAHVVGALTGTAFAAVPSEGYVSHERRFVIEKSCAGINFIAAAFGMLVFALFHRVRSSVSGLGVLGLSLVASYGAAVLVNAARITIALWLADHPVALPFTAAQVHRFEGIVVYFGGLMLLYQLVERVERRAALAVECRGASPRVRWSESSRVREAGRDH